MVASGFIARTTVCPCSTDTVTLQGSSTPIAGAAVIALFLAALGGVMRVLNDRCNAVFPFVSDDFRLTDEFLEEVDRLRPDWSPAQATVAIAMPVSASVAEKIRCNLIVIFFSHSAGNYCIVTSVLHERELGENVLQ